jgi:hypothetical protein
LSFPSTTAKLAGTIKQVQSEADATFFFSVDFTLLFRAPIPMPASLNEPEKCPRTRRHVPSSSEATAMFLQPVKSIHSASSIALFLFVWPVGWLQPSSRSLTPYFQRAWILCCNSMSIDMWPRIHMSDGRVLQQRNPTPFQPGGSFFCLMHAYIRCSTLTCHWSPSAYTRSVYTRPVPGRSFVTVFILICGR